MQNALAVDRGVERRGDELAGQLDGHRRQDEIDFAILLEFDERRRRQPVGRIGMDAYEVLSVRLPHRHRRQQLFDADLCRRTTGRAAGSPGRENGSGAPTGPAPLPPSFV